MLRGLLPVYGEVAGEADRSPREMDLLRPRVLLDMHDVKTWAQHLSRDNAWAGNFLLQIWELTLVVDP